MAPSFGASKMHSIFKGRWRIIVVTRFECVWPQHSDYKQVMFCWHFVQFCAPMNSWAEFLSFLWCCVQNEQGSFVVLFILNSLVPDVSLWLHDCIQLTVMLIFKRAAWGCSMRSALSAIIFFFSVTAGFPLRKDRGGGKRPFPINENGGSLEKEKKM